MKPKSVWIGDHAVRQYAARVEQSDPATLAKEDRIRITKLLLAFYQRAQVLTEANRAELKLPSKTKPGQERYFCTVNQAIRIIA
jgi:hypothetical protein